MTGSRKPQLDDAASPPPLQALAGNQLTTLLNATPDGIVLIDAGGAICSFNPGAERIFGYQAHEVLGRNIH